MRAVPHARRLAWVLCALALALVAAAITVRFTVAEASGPQALTPTEVLVGTLGFLGVPVVGGLLAFRLPDNPYGWLWCAAGICHGITALAAALGAVPGDLSRVARAVEGSSFVVGLVLLSLLFLLFPTGSLPSPRWRWLPRVTVGLAVLALVAGSLATSGAWSPDATTGRVAAAAADAAVTGLFLAVVVAAVSVLARYRRAGSVERRQLTWFVVAAMALVVTTSLDLTGAPVPAVVWAVVDAVSFGLIPAAVAVAVLRYRLYEIDRIVSRTVSYAVLTGALLVLYLAAVTALRPLLTPLTGTSDLAVVVSTLAAAAVFGPARRRVQDVVDRRFDRSRYDAARAVDAYARRLRSEVDLDAVTAGLRDTVAATVGPDRLGVWVRPGADVRRA
ncbi:MULTISPECIES: hypothetical protein [unclassified Geodermatophilus]